MGNIIIDPNLNKAFPTTTAKIDMTTLYYCKTDNMCLLRADLIDGKCPRCVKAPEDITGSPVAQAWLAHHHPTSRDRRKR